MCSGNTIDAWTRDRGGPNPDGPLAGEVVIFTGTWSIRRADAAARAPAVGGDVRDRVTTATTILVVGQQNLTRLGGYAKSLKQQTAEELIPHGAEIAILSETDFAHVAETAI